MDFCKKQGLQWTQRKNYLTGPAREHILQNAKEIIPIDQAVTQTLANIRVEKEICVYVYYIHRTGILPSFSKSLEK